MDNQAYMFGEVDTTYVNVIVTQPKAATEDVYIVDSSGPYDEPETLPGLDGLSQQGLVTFYKGKTYFPGTRGMFAMTDKDGKLMMKIQRDKKWTGCSWKRSHMFYDSLDQTQIGAKNYSRLCCDRKTKLKVENSSGATLGYIVQRHEKEFKVRNAANKTILRINYTKYPCCSCHNCCPCCGDCCNCEGGCKTCCNGGGGCKDCCKCGGCKKCCDCTDCCDCKWCSNFCKCCRCPCCTEERLPIFTKDNVQIGSIGNVSPTLTQIQEDLLFYAEFPADLELDQKILLVAAACFLNDLIFKKYRRRCCTSC